MKNSFLLTSIFLFSSYAYPQLGIGTNNPDTTSLLDIFSTDLGITIPQTALTSISVKTPITDAVDGLIVYNTTEDTSASLHQGLYYWSEANNNWQNLIVTDNIVEAFQDYGLEQPYVIANETTSQTINTTETPLTFSSTSLNKNNTFTTGTDSYFTAPETGRYNITCGMEVAYATKSGSDVATLSLKFYPSGSTTADDNQTITSIQSRGNITTYLIPTAIFSDTLNEGDIVRCTGTSNFSPASGRTTRVKYFYVKKY